MGEWNSMKTLDKYVHDYMIKKKMTRTAEIFAREANIAPTEVAIDHPDGFLSEWWSIFWDVFKFRLQNSQNNQGNGEEAADQATGNVPRSDSAVSAMPDPLAFGNMLQSLFSTMPMTEMNQQTLSLMQPAIASLAMNKDTVTMVPPSIPNPPMNQQAMNLLQSHFPNRAMNYQQGMGVMPPHSSSVLNPGLNKQVVGLMPPPSTVISSNPAMNQQALGMVRPPNSIQLNKPTMVVRIPPRSVSMNQQGMGMMQPPTPIPIMDQQAMGSMRPPNSIPMHQQIPSVMQPPSSLVSSLIHQQMLNQIPEEMRGEPVSILLAKMYEQECLRRSARELAAKAQQLDAAKMNSMVGSSSNPVLGASSNPILATSSRSSYLPQPNAAENIQQWLGREDKRPMNTERSSAVVLPTPRPASEVEIPDAGRNKEIQQIPVTRPWLTTGVGLDSPGLRNQFSHSFVSSSKQQQHFATFGRPQTTSVGLVSSGLGKHVSSSLGLLPNQQQHFTPSGGNYLAYTSPATAMAVKKSEDLMSSSPGSSHNPMIIDDLSRKDLQMPHDAQTVGGEKAEEKASPGETVPLNQQSDMNIRKRKQEGSSSAMDSAMNEKEAENKDSMDDDVDAYFAPDSENMASIFNTFQQSSSTQFTSEPQGFSFKEVGSLHSSNNKLLSCHFSSTGKLLAAAGHEKKVLLWDMENYSVNIVSGHSDIITDVRFQPNSTVFGTSSYDKTVLIWDANKRSKPLFNLTGHSQHVMSLDFHPRKVDLLSSSDSGGEVRFWDVNNSSCSHISEGFGTQARFHPQTGDLLAAAAGKYVNLIDVETKRIVGQLKGLNKDIRSICWNSTGQYIAAVSEDSARIWSINSGGYCLHAFHQSESTFESCTFHPAHCQLLVIGSNQSLHLWNPSENNRTWSYQAHESKIAALVESPLTETMASASHDQWLKLWK